MTDHYAHLIDRLKGAVLNGPGETTPGTRQTIADGSLDPADAAAYLAKVRASAHAVTDADVQALQQAGYSDDAIFEMTISAALGAGLQRLHVGLDAIRGRD